jgi:hypothetical protein
MDSSIKSIKLVRILGTANILPGNDKVKVLPAVKDRYIYQIYMEKSLFYVRYGQIIDHIGDEPWLRSELTCLCNISSHRKVMLTMGAKKKSNSPNSSSITSREGIDVGHNMDKHEIVSGDRVIVTNHGNLFPIGVVKAIDVVHKVAKIRWESSGKTSSVELCNVLPYVIDESSKRKRTSTDFLIRKDLVENETKKRKHLTDNAANKIVQKTPYFSDENSSKLCAEGALKNLLCMLKMKINYFWWLATSPLSDISDCLESNIPKEVCNSHTQVNSIQKCLWILRQKFQFTTTKKIKLECFSSVKKTLRVLGQLKFPVIISVNSGGAIYDHVIVVWNGQVLDYESEVIYTLTEDSLQQMCGDNTSFRSVTSGYGIFPSTEVKKNCQHIEDWGENSWFGKDSQLRKYFVR